MSWNEFNRPRFSKLALPLASKLFLRRAVEDTITTTISCIKRITSAVIFLINQFNQVLFRCWTCQNAFGQLRSKENLASPSSRHFLVLISSRRGRGRRVE